MAAKRVCAAEGMQSLRDACINLPLKKIFFLHKCIAIFICLFWAALSLCCWWTLVVESGLYSLAVVCGFLLFVVTSLDCSDFSCCEA